MDTDNIKRSSVEEMDMDIIKGGNTEVDDISNEVPYSSQMRKIVEHEITSRTEKSFLEDGVFDPDLFKKKNLHAQWVVRGKFSSYNELLRNLDYWHDLKAEEALLHYCILKKDMISQSLATDGGQFVIFLLTVADIDKTRVNKMICPTKDRNQRLTRTKPTDPGAVVEFVDFDESDKLNGYKLDLELFDPQGKITLCVEDLSIVPAIEEMPEIDCEDNISNVMDLVNYFKLRLGYVVKDVRGDYCIDGIERRLRWIMRHKNSLNSSDNGDKESKTKEADARVSALAKNFIMADGLGKDKSWLYMYLDRYVYFLLGVV